MAAGVSKAERDLWYTSSDRAHSWFEGQKSDLSNPFETRNQIEILKRNHDVMEAQIRSMGNSEERTRQHDFYTECLGLVSQWQDHLNTVASKKPPQQEAVDNVQKWAKGLFSGIPTEGKTAQQIAEEQARLSKGPILDSRAMNNFYQLLASAKEQITSGNERKQRDPTAQWDIDYWTSYQAELLTLKDFLVDQSAKSEAYQRTKGPSEADQKIIEAGLEYIENVLPLEKEKERLAEEERKALIEAEKKRMQQESQDRIDSMNDGSGESSYLWIAVGVAAAGVLGMAVFL